VHWQCARQNIFIQEQIILRLTFNPGLALVGFRARPWFQLLSQCNLWYNCVSVYYLSGYAHNCSDIVIPACKGIVGYTKTVVSKEVQKKYQAWIERKIDFDPSKDNCSKPRQEIICAENLPACVDSTAAFLCRDNCYKFFNTCTSPFFYGKDMCMEFPKRGDTPKDSVVCKQTHWPRTENWKLYEKPTSQTGKAGWLSSLFVCFCFNVCKLCWENHSLF